MQANADTDTVAMLEKDQSRSVTRHRAPEAEMVHIGNEPSISPTPSVLVAPITISNDPRQTLALGTGDGQRQRDDAASISEISHSRSASIDAAGSVPGAEPEKLSRTRKRRHSAVGQGENSASLAPRKTVGVNPGVCPEIPNNDQARVTRSYNMETNQIKVKAVVQSSGMDTGQIKCKQLIKVVLWIKTQSRLGRTTRF